MTKYYNIDIIIKNKLPVVTGVPKFMRELFSHLITNAVKFMDKPYGWIEIGCVEDGDFWKFSVADNGSGIEEKYFERIFKIFQTLSLRDETENIGIGLPIVKKIVELYDGRVWVESKIGQGSTFLFTLPKSTPQQANNVYVLASANC